MDAIEQIGFRDLWQRRYPDGREYSWFSTTGSAPTCLSVRRFGRSRRIGLFGLVAHDARNREGIDDAAAIDQDSTRPPVALARTRSRIAS